MSNLAPNPMGTPTSAEDCLSLVVRALATHSGATPDRIEVDKPLSAIPGIESVKALRAITEVETSCDIVIPDDFLFETSTVRELGMFVARLVRERHGEPA